MDFMKTIENCTVQDLINELKTIPLETKVISPIYQYDKDSNTIDLEFYKDELTISGNEGVEEEVPW